MAKNKRSNKKIVKKIADVRMNYLFNKAHDIYLKDRELANRYIYLARRYAQRAKVQIPNKWNKRICHKCKNLLYPGINCRTRIHSKGKGSHVSTTCLDCNHTTRYFIKLK
ncbi:MAG: ribonuclease P protein component 4 [Candidatus Hermodarchaeota archaeon]